MTIWFIAAAAVLIVELFTGTVYLTGRQRGFVRCGTGGPTDGQHGNLHHDGGSVVRTGYLAGARQAEAAQPLRAQEAAADDLDIGQSVQVVRHLHGDMYEVSYRGTRWQAQASQQPVQTPQPQ